jgi:F-type H+-transporting ATPase subunit gamma
METLEILQRKIATTEALHSIVKTMKALAAVNIRQYEKAVTSLQEYNRAIELGLQVVLKMSLEGGTTARTAPHGRVGAIVIGSDQGMCGALNEQIVSHTLESLRASGVRREEHTMVAVGLRVTTRLEDAGEFIEHVLPAPGSAETITPLVQTLLITIEEWQAQRGVDRLLLFYNRFLSGAKYHPHSLQLLPLDVHWLRALEKKAWPSPVLPLVTMDRDRLFSRLIRQYLFVALSRACAESLASENASRLASMQNAERNIVERFDELQAQFHRQRQTEITGELLDIVAGFEALGGARL